jgi:hypothetical protein
MWLLQPTSDGTLAAVAADDVTSGALCGSAT